MAPAKRRNVSLEKATKEKVKKPKIDPDSMVNGILENRKNANEVFDIFELLQVQHTIDYLFYYRH